MSHFSSHSPPPLRHPVPTHPAYIPEPPATPGSPQGYKRYSSTPTPPLPHLQPQQPQYAHVPAYTSPFQHNQPPLQPHLQPPQHQPQRQQFAGAPGVPPPDFGAWGMNDVTAQFGFQLGQSAVAAGQDYVQRNLGGVFPLASIKHHFNVSNSYVIKKLQLVLFPWRHRPWSRRVRQAQQGQGVEWQPPREDINAPDLYIPVMAIVTYVLLSAFLSGLNDRFHPQVLGESASRAVLILLLDFGFVYIGCYFLNVHGSLAVDLISYSGYKFVGVIAIILTTFINTWSRTLSYVFFTYFFAANAFFLLRSLRSTLLPSDTTSPTPSTSTISPSQRRKRIIFLFCEAVFCQLVYMGVLVRI